MGPLRRALAAVCARLLDTRGYEGMCFARLGDYARERAGLSARQIQDLARVDRALRGLPRLERALLVNELPWSKLRLLARVARPEDESEWLHRAHGLTVRQLEALVRAARPVSERCLGDEDRPTRRVAVRCTPAVREEWSRVCELAERVAGERLRGDEALEWVAAEVFAAFGFDPAPERWEGAGSARRAVPAATPATPRLRVTGCGPAPELAELLAGLDEADASALDRRLRSLVRLEQTLDASIAPLLRVVASAEYEWSGALQPLGEFARESLGMAPSKARALRRLDRASGVCPSLGEAFRSGRLSWLKAHCLLPLFLLDIPGEWRPRWVAWAERVTLRRLEADVERALLLRAGHSAAWHRCKFDPERAQDTLPESERPMCAPDVDIDATHEIHWRTAPEVAQIFAAARETMRARLGGASDGEAFQAMLECAVAAWEERDPSARRPDPVIERDGYRCMAPGCTSRRNLHDHHIVFRSLGGSDEPANRVTLCAFHHQRGVHGGLMRVEGSAPGELVFEFGWGRFGSGDVRL